MKNFAGFRGLRSAGGKGPFRFADYEDNHVVWPESRVELRAFVRQTFGGQMHKWKNAHSSHSEDALTWSCFDTLRRLPTPCRRRALARLWSLCFLEPEMPDELEHGSVFLGKQYPERSSLKSLTEVDASIESKKTLVFVEAKLYSPMSPADPGNPNRPKEFDQIALKLRVGASEAAATGRDFYFILLDIAPMEALRSMRKRASLADATDTNGEGGFSGKWRTAYWFSRYRYGRRGSLSPLKSILSKSPAIEHFSAAHIARHMGWLTWADLFKIVLQEAGSSK